MKKGTTDNRGAYYYNTDESLTFQEISVSGERASASVYEWFRYMDSTVPYDDVITESGVGLDYRLELVKRDGAWYISAIDFDDEATECLKNGEMAVEELLNSRGYIAEPAVIPSDDMDYDAGICAMGEGTYTYLNTAKLQSYAITYSSNSSGTSSYNPLFANYASSGGDCQNFASQCIWYGLGGTNDYSHIHGKSKPMVTGGNHQWYQSDISGDCSQQWSWTSCTAFGTYIQNSSGKEGPNGTIYDGIKDARVGDLIQFSKNNNSSYDHVYVVVAANGTQGSRTPSQLIVCAHTTNRLSCSLAEVYTSKYTWRTIHVTYDWRKADPHPVV